MNPHEDPISTRMEGEVGHLMLTRGSPVFLPEPEARRGELSRASKNCPARGEGQLTKA